MQSRWDQLRGYFSSEERCEKPSCVEGVHARPNNVYPPDRSQIGRANWKYVHTRASHFPADPSQQQKDSELKWIESFIYSYPCRICARSFAEICYRLPPHVASRKAYEEWWILAHDEVNSDLSKPAFQISRIE